MRFGTKQRYGDWALVTGGSEGVGECFADLLAREGMNLVLVARRKEPLEKKAAEIRGKCGVEVRIISADLSNSSDVERIKQEAGSLPIGVLICNAGADTDFDDFVDSPIGRSDDVIGLNVLSTVHLTHFFGKKMRDAGRGGIILCGSLAGYMGSPGIVIYAAAKAFMMNFAEGLWGEMREHNVDVLGFVVGPTDTHTMRRSSGAGLKGLNSSYDTAVDALSNLAEGPIKVVSPQAERAESLRSMDRRVAVEGALQTCKMFRKLRADLKSSEQLSR